MNQPAEQPDEEEWDTMDPLEAFVGMFLTLILSTRYMADLSVVEVDSDSDSDSTVIMDGLDEEVEETDRPRKRGELCTWLALS